MHELMLALMTWLAPVTGLPPTDPPEVVYADQCVIEQMFFGDDQHECANTVVAIYDRDGNRVFLPNTWSASNLYDVSVLLHELVHHMQNAAGVEYECLSQSEKEAYAAQVEWLKASGVDPYKVMQSNPLAIHLRSMCPQHPY